MTDILARRAPEGAPTTPREAGMRAPAPQRAASQRLTMLTYAVATFLGAGLVFFLEPMAVKMLLPAFGGSAAVWNTAMVFFQAALLAGYAYAHALGKVKRLRGAAFAHAGAATLVALLLPPVVNAAGGADFSNPFVGVVALLTLGVGVPFLAIASAGPLLQRWFASTSHPRRSDPYFLYAAGNLGSLTGLLLYPLLVEPRLTLTQQAQALRYGLVVFAVMSLVCAVSIARRPQSSDEAHHVSRPPWRQRLRWIVLAAAPSALMLGATNHVATDIASFPLLWVIPLGLYLGSFVIAFGPGGPRAGRVSLVVLPLLGLAAAASAVFTSVGMLSLSPAAQLAIHWSLLLTAATACHCRLAAGRPSADSLTTFYLCLSTGGVVGGLLVGIVAPLVLNSVADYPAAIAAALVLAGGAVRAERHGRSRQLLIGGALLAAGTVVIVEPSPFGAAAAFTIAIVPWVGVRRIAVVATCASALFSLLSVSAVLHADRTFYGVHRLSQRSDGTHVLANGTTVHGLQQFGAHEDEPLGYYHRRSPVGEIFEWAADAPSVERVAAVGLGAGALAAYSESNQHWTFYDVDQSVVDTAKDPRFFTYLSNARGKTEIEVVDGRLGIQRLPENSVDVLVLDAFTSDAIPVHLLTREAFALYASKLREGGVITVHISNRYLELEPVLGATTRAAGLTGRHWNDTSGAGNAFSSHWAVFARASGGLAHVDLSDNWKPVTPGSRAWTDDFSDVWSAIRW